MAGPAPEVTSTRSDRVVRVRRLATRSFRQETGRFVAEGPQSVREALAVDGVVETVYATPRAHRDHPDLVASGARVVVVTDEVLAAMADTVHPQGLLAVCRTVDVALDSVLASRPRLVAVLAEVSDPGNAGTVLRTADAAGADAVVLTAGSVDAYNPKVVRSTAGSLFHLPVCRGVETVAALAALRAGGLQVLAADGDGDVDLFDLDGLAAPTAWVFGNEARGLPPEVRQQADHVVAIPIRGRAESLNLAAAAAVCLYASARAQR